MATISGNGKTATVTAKSEGSVTVTASYTANGTTVKDTCNLTVKKAASTLKISNAKYPRKSTLSNFTFTCDVSSNYHLTRMDMKGYAYSAPLDRTFTDSGSLSFDPGIYKTGSLESSLVTEFLKLKYNAIYTAYWAVATLFGADSSLDITVDTTFYDASGKSATLTIYYTIEG